MAVPQTPTAVSVTATLPTASLRERSQTERTLASPYLSRINTLATPAARARNPINKLQASFQPTMSRFFWRYSSRLIFSARVSLFKDLKAGRTPLVARKRL